MELQTNIDSGDVKIKRTTEASTGATETIITKEPDLVTRVSQVKVEPKPEPRIDDSIFNVNEIEQITDPKAKEYAQKAYKSFQADYTRKSQALADEKRALEAQKAQEGKWTTNKVQSLLNDPEFIQAAQTIVGTPQAQDDASILTDAEKQRIARVEQLANTALQQNARLLKEQQDETLKGRYANYSPQAIDILTADMIAGKVQATREHLHKVLDYDDAIQRAYELGKADRKLENVEKAGAISTEGGQATSTEPALTPEKEESNRAFWGRIIDRNVKKFAEGAKK